MVLFKGIFTILVVMSTFDSSLSSESSMILGLNSGELLRCDFNDATNCKKLNTQDSAILSVAISGEFIYIGLESGVLKRCHQWTKTQSCTTFHKTSSEINTLAFFGGYIYAGLMEGNIWQCGVRKFETCKKIHESDKPIYSLVVSGEYMYTSQEMEIRRCQLKKPDNCVTIYNAHSKVNTFIISENNIYIGLEDGVITRCKLKSDTTNDCSAFYTADSEIISLDIHDEYIQASLDDGKITRCNLNNNDTCSTVTTKSDSVILTVASLYSTTDLKQHYVGESNTCSWQFYNCPPYLIYYDIEGRSSLELHIRDGKVYSANGELFDTSEADYSHSGMKAIFVMDPAGRLYASNQHPILLLHHSSLIAGNPVAAAGELKVINGEIKSVSSCSGHYRPTANITNQVVTSLKRQGYFKEFQIIDCSRISNELLIDLDYNKTALYYEHKMKDLEKKATKNNNG